MSQQRPSFLSGDGKLSSEKDKDSSLRKPAEASRPFSSLRSTTGTTGSTLGSGLGAGSGKTESPFRSSFGSQTSGSSLGSGSAFSSGLRSSGGLGSTTGSGQTGGLSSGLSSPTRPSAFSRPATPAGTGLSSPSSGLGTSLSPFRSSLGQQTGANAAGAGTGGLRSPLSGLSRPGQDAAARPGLTPSSPFFMLKTMTVS